MESQELTFVDEKVSRATLAMLLSYRKWGVLSRTFMLREHSAKLDEIQNNVGKYATYPDEAKRFLEARIYVELLERICLLIEDFCTMCYALSGDLLNFPAAIVAQPSPQKVLSQLNEDKLRVVMRYGTVHDLPISDEDKQFVEQVRCKHVLALSKRVDFIKKFLDLYWIFFTKHKHSNPLLYGFEMMTVDGEPTTFIPAMFNSKQPDKVTGIMVNRSIFGKWQQVHDMIVLFIQDLVDRTILFVRRSGVPLVEHTVYYSMTEADQKRLQQILDECNQTVTTVDVTAEIQAEVGVGTLKKHQEFYASFTREAFEP